MVAKYLQYSNKAWLLLLATTALLGGCGSEGINPESKTVDFNWHIRPLLSENCFLCHEPDVDGGQKAGLRLDGFLTATAELPESPGKFAIIPGRPEASELIKRIKHSDPEEIIPPPDTHKTLSGEQIALFEKWIEEGAEHKPHWSYIKPEKVEPPETPYLSEASNKVDLFVHAKLQEEDLTPSQSANFIR